MRTGKFIIIDGPNRVGKTTLQRKILDHIPNSVGIKFPSPDNKALAAFLCGDNMLSPQDAITEFAKDRQSQMPLIAEMLKKGITVIADRYVYSGWAFGQLSTGIHWKILSKQELDWIIPDKIIIVKNSTDYILNKDNIFGGADKQRAVCQIFEEIAVYFNIPCIECFPAFNTVLNILNITI